MAHSDDDDGTAKTVVRPVFVPGQAVAPGALDPAVDATPPGPVDPLLGVMLGEYQVLGFLGAGAMGNVYRGVQPLIGRPVAIKVMRPEFSADPSHARRFLEEARSVSAARHPGIVDVFGFGVAPTGEPYLVMELLEGEGLDVLLQARGALPVKEALALFIPMMHALGAAHAAGVVHRDLKPANVFVVKLHDGTTFPKLVDFGLARRGLVGGVQLQTSVAGTPAYFPPEQARGEPVGPGSDLYGFGCLAYEVLSGSPPFTAVAYGELLQAHLSQRPRSLRETRPEVPEALDRLVLQLLEKDVARRPGSAAEVREGFERVQASLGSAQPQPPGEPATTRRPREDRPAAVAPGAARWPVLVVAGLALVGALGGLWLVTQAPGEPAVGETNAPPRPARAPVEPPVTAEPAKAPAAQEVPLPPPTGKPAADGPGATKGPGLPPAGPPKGPRALTAPSPAATDGSAAPRVSRGARHTDAEVKRKREQLHWRMGKLPDSERPAALLRLRDSRDCVARSDACWQELIDIEALYFPR